MGQDLSRRFNLVENVWFDAPCPIVIFTYSNVLEQAEGIAEHIKHSLLNAEILEIGNVGDLEGTTVFRMFIDNHILNFKLNQKYSNLVLTSIKKATAGRKIKFIESSRKIINVSEHGVIFLTKDEVLTDNIVEPEDRAKAMKEKFALRLLGVMPEKEYSLICDYISSDSKAIDMAGFEHFDELYLKTVSDYAELEYQAEQNDIDEAPGITYLSRRSIKLAGDKSQKYIYEFICPDFNTEQYPPGTEISVTLFSDTEESKKAFGSIINIEDDEDEQKKITVTFKNQFNDNDLPVSGGEIRKTANTCQKNVRDNVVTRFRTKEVKAEYMYKTFNSPADFPTSGFDTSIDMKPVFQSMKQRDVKSNPKQIAAITKGIQTKDIALVLGPPGTGKTTVIVEWAIYHIKQKQRILISSKNNKAVDNVFERIARLCKDEDFIKNNPEFKSLGMLRIGNVDKVQHNVRDYMPENQHDSILKRVEKSYTNTLKKINHDTEEINKAKKILNEYYVHIDRFLSLRSELDSAYSSVNAHSKQLVGVSAKLDKTENALIKKLEEIAKKKIYLEEIEKKNVFIRFLHRKDTKIIRSEYDKLTANVKGTDIKQLNEYTAEYKKHVKELKKRLADPAFISKKNEYIKLEAILKNAPEIKISPLLPYESFTYSYSTSKKQLDKFKENLKGLEEKVTSALAILNDWKMTVADKNNSVLSSILINTSSVVGATCIGINSNRKFASIDFDVAIIDEAGQIQIHDIIVPMSRANKTLMLGDYKQIPPMVDEKMKLQCEHSRCDTTLLEQSFFEYLYENKYFPDENKVNLDTQFRMPEEVADILSYQFYNGEYYSFETKKNMPSLFPKIFKKPLAVIDTSDSSNRREQTDGTNKYNTYEAEIIVKLLQKIDLLGSDDISTDDIGIIAPLKRQRDAIREAVKKSFPQLKKANREAMIATLDSFQGQERQLIIYSCTRSNTRNKIGFLTELRRLNVALSRCQSQIVIIGDFDFLTTCTDETEDIHQYAANIEEDDTIEYSTHSASDEDDEDDEDNAFAQIEKNNRSHKISAQFAPEKTVKRFSEFMSYLLYEVKSGKGDYIKSKDF